MTVSPHEARAALKSFQRAFENGDVQGLLDVLAPNVVLIADGGGIKQAAVRPVLGAARVIRLIAGGLRKAVAAGFELSAAPAVVNGNPALLLRLNGEVDGIMTIRVEDARITGIYYVRNPEKLRRLDVAVPLAFA